tara:strand:- start:593 stop:736 length:144 start_codon:yes stop_codon:yes gene_type:complete
MIELKNIYKNFNGSIVLNNLSLGRGFNPATPTSLSSYLSIFFCIFAV